MLTALALVLVCTPFAIAAVRQAKRGPGGAILLTGLFVVCGMDMQIMPPLPPLTEQLQRQARDAEPED
jgi:hypothetical protein